MVLFRLFLAIFTIISFKPLISSASAQVVYVGESSHRHNSTSEVPTATPENRVYPEHQDSSGANIAAEDKTQRSIDDLVNSGTLPPNAAAKFKGLSPDADETIARNSRAARLRNLPKQSFGPREGGVGVYYAAVGDNLYSVLQHWAGLNGWKIQYDAELSYPIDESATFRGSFIECATAIIENLRKSTDPIPEYKFYAANNTLRIWNYDGGL